MDRITRVPEHPWFGEEYEKPCKEEGEKWEQHHKFDKKKTFRWEIKQYGDLRTKLFLPALKTMTNNHCSFCDVGKMGPNVQDTIDHFRPKSIYHRIAYQWANLFLACRNCQGKGDNFDEKLLKPDDADYSFDKYFQIDWTDGRLEPKETADLETQARAKITIEFYKLNKNGKPKARLDVMEFYQEVYNDKKKLAEYENKTFQVSDYKILNIDRYSYRFILRRGCLQ